MSRRWQFSLRALLVVVTFTSMWLGVSANTVRRQRDALSRIESLGAIGYYAYEWNESRDWFHSGATVEPGPTWLRNLLGIDWLNPIVAVRFGGSSISDADLNWLSERLPELRYLDLSHTAIGDGGISNIGRLRQLRNLEIAHTNVGDGALDAIGRVRSLRSLDLCGTSVTDNGLPSLYGLTDLRTIYVESTAVTLDGVVKLKKALPQVTKRRY